MGRLSKREKQAWTAYRVAEKKAEKGRDLSLQWVNDEISDKLAPHWDEIERARKRRWWS
ncbi:hypothetical protein [Pseudonocardia spinosispora]|uniref:hypothetical protein n=1 Tax=Pseudonocardia spinosispora TaxID=103441 RepID=UPI0004138AEA|nr:hypothetical protein [Pseudonocardia spinosispora]